MAGTIVANTINTDTAGGPFTTNNAFNGIAKAWCNLNVSTAASPVINASFNVSSVTYVATGNWTINFVTGTFTDAFYAPIGTSSGVTGAWTFVGVGCIPSVANATKTSSACSAQVLYATTTAGTANELNLAFFR